MTPLRVNARRAGVLLPVALAVAGVALLAGGPAGPAPGAAGDRYRAGERAVERRALPADDVAIVRARGLAHARSLGLPTGSRARATRVVDRFAGHDLDEVVVRNEAGDRLAIVRMRLDGRLVAAVRLGWRDRDGASIDQGRAAFRAADVARSAGLVVGGRPAVARDVDGGWRATWGRTVDGIAVLGDGASVTLFADGTLHAVAERRRPLAPEPAAVLGRETAERLARERLATLLGDPDAEQATVVGLDLAWVAPNDTFDSAAPDAPDPVLRLAWVARARTHGALVERLRALELYLDAGDGALLGGDLLR
jgi:hypothetical protein